MNDGDRIEEAIVNNLDWAPKTNPAPDLDYCFAKNSLKSKAEKYGLKAKLEKEVRFLFLFQWLNDQHIAGTYKRNGIKAYHFK